MSTIEDRLRDALAEQATRSPVSQDAWERTLAKSRREPVPQRRGWRWPKWLAPIAAAAAVGAVIVGATSLAGNGSLRGGGDSPAAGGPGHVTTLPSHWPADDGGILLKQVPASSGIGEADLTVGRQLVRVFMWYGQDTNGDVPAMAYVLNPGPANDFGGVTDLTGTPPHASGLGVAGTVHLGVTTAQATGVVARLNDGGQVSGILVNRPGFPQPVWVTNVPADASARVIVQNASGGQVSDLPVAMALPELPLPARGAIAVDSSPAHPAIAYRDNGKLNFYFPQLAGDTLTITGSPLDGAVSGYTSAEPLPSAGSGLTHARSVPGDSTSVVYYGYARRDAARVVIQIGGRSYTAHLVAGWPGSGIRLWALTVPSSGLIPPATVTGYDAAGHVLGQVRLR